MLPPDVKEKAKKALEKPSALGPDIDIGSYSTQVERHDNINVLREMDQAVEKAAVEVGMSADETCRSGSFFQVDHSIILASAHDKGLEVMGTQEALKKYDWLSEYYWKAVAVDTDKFTARAEVEGHSGYFIRALSGAKVELPLQACLFMGQEGMAQNVHNIIIAEEGSELHIITGCATGPGVHSGLHIGVSEFFLMKNAHITFTMIHNWAEGMAVRPRSAALLDENAVFLSNYVCMRPVKTLQMYPAAYLTGPNSVARFNSILVAPAGSDMDVGARVYLRGEGTRAEVISRAITTGGHIVARGHLVGEVPGIKAHLECRGLILSDKGSIRAVPELEGKTEGVDMSHEAAVGKIDEEEIQYLMARGLTSDDAASAIVRGFLDVEIKGLPDALKNEMDKAIHQEKERLL